MSQKESVIEKIRKLLALANGKNANVHETANAAAAAQRLMLEHKIGSAEIQDSGEGDDDVIGEVTVQEASSHRVSWRQELIFGLARNLCCKAIGTFAWNGQVGKMLRTFEIIGTKSDADSVAYLFGYLTREIDRLADEDKAGSGKAYYNAFRRGAVIEIIQRLDQQVAERLREFERAASGTRALAVLRKSDDQVNAYMKDKHPKLTKIRPPSIRDLGGFVAGRQAGASIGLPGKNQAIGAASKQLGGRSE